MRKLIDYFIHRSIFGNLISAGIILMGAYYFFTIQREAFSRVEFDIVIINTVYPGASPAEVEKLVTIPIERELKDVEGIKKINSTSLDSRSGVVLTLEPDINEKIRVLQDIRDATDRAKIELPEDAEEPVVTELTSARTPIIEVTMNTKPEAKTGMTEYQLRDAAKQLQDRLELIPEVASVIRRGYRDREIFVEVDPIKMYAYNISSDEIINALSLRNLNYPGGAIKGKGKEYNIRTVQEFEKSTEIEDVILRYNDFGGDIRISDVAKVKDDFEEKSIIEKTNGREAIILTVLKREKADAIDLVDKVKDEIAKYEKEKPKAYANLQISTVSDISFFIRRRLSVLGGNVVIGIILVLASLFFFLGWRVAIMVAFGIPFSFAITFIVMGFSGISVNLISMFGLIIVSGMIVDDAIVVGENIYRLIEKGTPPLKAAVTGAQEMLLPVIAAVTTTMVAFMPLMFMGGIMGKFIWTMPAAVVIALAASLFESFFILPAHILDITSGKDKKEVTKKEGSWEFKIFAFLQRVYKKILVTALNYRYLVVFLCVGLFFMAIGLIKATGFSLFPKVAIETFFIKAETASGISLEEMNSRLAPYELAVLNLRPGELDSVTSRVGIHQENPSDPFTKRGNNYAMLTVYLTPETDRERDSNEIIAALQQELQPERPVLFAGGNKDTTYVLTNRPEVLVYNGTSLSKRYKVPGEKFLAGGAYKNGKLYVYGGANNLYVYDTKTMKFEKTEFHLNKVPIKFKISPDATFAALFFNSGELYELDMESREMEFLYKYRNEQVTDIVIPTANLAIITTDKGSFELWNYDQGLERGLTAFRFPAHLAEIRSDKPEEKKPEDLNRVETAASFDGAKTVWIGTFDGVLALYDVEQEEFVQRYDIFKTPVYWFSPAGKDKFWVSTLNKVSLYDTKRKTILKSYEIKGVIERSISGADGKMMLGTNGIIALINGDELEIRNKGHVVIEKLQFKEVRGGPPVGEPISIQIRGDEFETLQKISSIIQLELSSIRGVYDIRDSWESDKEEYHVTVNERKAALAGVSVMQVASTIQTAFDGRVATSIKKVDEEIDIRVIFPERLRNTLTSLNEVTIKNTRGNLVPITELATFRKKPGINVISHEDHKRTITVQANLDEKKTSSVEANNEIIKRMESKMPDFPGYSLDSGGEVEDTRESMGNLVRSAFIALLGIGGILVLLFGNLRHPRVIMVVIPLGVIGVAIAFFVHKFFDRELVLSFMATLGIVGLIGVVINDSIVYVDFINKMRHLGFSKRDSIIQAGLSRLRPVILTTVTTVFGLLPTAYGVGGNDPFLKPMALAMAWGLMFATFITLVVIPSYYSIWEDRGYVFHKYVIKERFKNGR